MTLREWLSGTIRQKDELVEMRLKDKDYFGAYKFQLEGIQVEEILIMLQGSRLIDMEVWGETKSFVGDLSLAWSPK